MSRVARARIPLALCVLAVTSGSAQAQRAAAEPTAVATIASLGIPAAIQTRLDNGLTVLLERNDRAPFVAMRMRYETGTRDDPPGKPGLAALTRRMTALGTRHVPAGTHDVVLDHVGALEYGAMTTLDATDEWVTVPSDAIENVLWLWSDEMGFFVPSDPRRSPMRAPPRRRPARRGSTARRWAR
jgi:hypothetical protein